MVVSLPKNVYVYVYCILVKRCEINKEFVTLHGKTGITGTRAMTRHARGVIEHINRQKKTGTAAFCVVCSSLCLN